MASLFLKVLQVTLLVNMTLVMLLFIFIMYHQSFPFSRCQPLNNTAAANPINKPVMLLWFWPENRKFDFQDCETLFKIDSCYLTDDRSLYSRARAVLVFHRAIHDDLSNLPSLPRGRFQRWIWFNMDPPNRTQRIESLQGLFNLTLSYRRDADIHIRWKLTVKKNPKEDFVLPKKKHLVCWIVDGNDPHTKSSKSYDYYRELVKYIKVDVFNSSSDNLKGKNFFLTISSCKFYLSFEDSIYRDYITEAFNGPLASGTVPIVFGPTRRNYEDFAPGSSFIHVDDFSEPAKLAEHLLMLEKDNETYMRYFDWRQFYTATHHLTEEKHEFAHAICQACHYINMFNEYRVVPDLYKWFFV